MPKKTFKSTEFVPLSADEDADSAAKPAPKKQLVVQLPTGGMLEAGKLTSENIGEGYSVYNPHEPCKKIGKVIKVKPHQPGEIDDSAVVIMGQRPTATPKLTRAQLTELGEAITTLEADNNSALAIYKAIEKEMVELTAEQTRAMDTFKVATD
ncbi:hypothetical protein HYDPIDRAFT_33498 [Hydnomerulius pinastri MD-312]|uniref:Unplaced genomic scaffold scaffold_63, whole genome shotgun sequence n=1 Tax=Hydnomerulius pinastri MD-312 TaxID=994086 RepID=A0A0C9W016_9AGAM|nr:hypothetical protein HYDPIDRAFT_33498 [Hydnomerulius pinastri MD-312]